MIKCDDVFQKAKYYFIQGGEPFFGSSAKLNNTFFFKKMIACHKNKIK